MHIASVRDRAEPHTNVLEQSFAFPGMFLDHEEEELKMKSFYLILMASKKYCMFRVCV